MADDGPFGKPRTNAGDTLKPAVLGTMMNLVRTSTLLGKVDIGAMTAFITANWAQMYADGALVLQPLYAHLLALPGVVPNEVALIFLVLKKREARLGLRVELPAAVERLGAEEKSLLLDSVARGGTSSGLTHSGRAPVTGAAAGLADRVHKILHGRKE